MLMKSTQISFDIVMIKQALIKIKLITNQKLDDPIITQVDIEEVIAQSNNDDLRLNSIKIGARKDG